MFCLPQPSEVSLKAIFKVCHIPTTPLMVWGVLITCSSTYNRTAPPPQAITKGFFAEFPAPVKDAAEAIVNASVEIYGRMSTDLLPTPAKSHYLFNLRDLSKCIQGLVTLWEKGGGGGGGALFRVCLDDLGVLCRCAPGRLWCDKGTRPHLPPVLS